MGGHGGLSGYKKVESASTEIAKAKDALHGGLINLGEYKKAKIDIFNKYGLTSDEMKLATGMTNMQTKKEKQQAYKELKGEKTSLSKSEGANGSVGNVSRLPGQNGNPWPPDAGVNHLTYGGKSGNAIWKQFGGGVKNGGVTHANANEMYKAVDSFTGPYYGQIRKAIKAGDTTGYYGAQGVKCEEFIAAGIKAGKGWNGGATYRGVGGLSNDALKAIHNMKPGDSIDCNWGGPASWSTNRGTSEHFGSGYNHVTFVHVGKSQKGVSVAKIAHYGTHEQEVLVSKDAKYRVTAVVPGPVGAYGQTYVYVESVD